MAKASEKNIGSIFRQYGNRLMGFIRGRVNNDADAEDISQDVWFQLSKVVNIDEIESLSGWLYQVARNRITDRYRKKQIRSVEDFAFEDEDGEVRFRDLLLADDSDSPEVNDFKEIFWEELMLALEELPEQQRNVFVWNELEDRTLQEIADKTNENLKTIISRKRYAVQHLRKRLQDLYNELNNF